MLANEEVVYKRAYKELYCVIGILTKDELKKIPKQTIDNIKRKMDDTYEISIDKNKTLLEQKLMPETQALIIELYQKYLSPEEDKEIWKRYNQICYEKSEEEKKKKYNPDDLFKAKKEKYKQNELIVVENKSFIKKIIEKIKSFFSFKNTKE